ncbi:MAG TPA: hypothetical protein ENN13_02290 [Candidatus Altiarchaeales archaeon]|nr:hypothetical protein [Candidatus Altiarchaeales archaeon]
MDLKDALREALDFEKKGRRIYLQTAAGTKNPHVKKTFEFLANEEVNHIHEIEEFMQKENPEVELHGAKLDEVQKFFTTTVNEFRGDVDIVEDDVKAYETLMELEKKSYDFYEQRYNEAQDEQTKKFFMFLMDQESAHFTLLSKDLDYLRDPVGFFGKEEQHFFEGG